MRYMLAILVLALLASNAYCEEVTLEKSKYAVSAGLGLMNGHSTYQIGGKFKEYDGSGNVAGSGKVRFPISELEFPVDVYYGSLGAKVNVTEKLEVAAGLKKNLSKGTGKMKDRDWGIAYEEINWWDDPDSLDIHSVSDMEMEALVADISARYYFHPWRYRQSEFLFFIGGQYIYQKFEFIASNLDQWYPSLSDYYGFDVGHIFASGDVLTYDVTKKIPALIAGTKLVTGPDFTLDISLGYSPFVTVKDEDHHLERYFEEEGPHLFTKADCDGDAFLCSISGELRLFTRWSLGIAYDYITIDTKGKETQYHPDGDVVTIEQKNFSDLHMYEITLSYRF